MRWTRLTLGLLLGLGYGSAQVTLGPSAPEPGSMGSVALLEVAGGDFVSLPLTVQNGAGQPAPDGTQLSAALPTGWNTLSEPLVTGGQVLFNVFVPDDAPAGTYPLRLQATLPGGQVVSGAVNVTVKAQPRIEWVPLPASRAETDVPQIRVLTIRNLGNRTETLHLNTENARFDPPVLTLAPGAEGTAKLMFTVRPGGNAAVYSLRASSTDDLAVAVSSVTVYTGQASGSTLGRPRLSGRVNLGGSAVRVSGAEREGAAQAQTAFGVNLSSSVEGRLSDSVGLSASLDSSLAQVQLSGERWTVLGTVASAQDSSGSQSDAGQSESSQPAALLNWWDGLLPLRGPNKTFGVSGDYDFGAWQLGAGLTYGRGSVGAQANVSAPGGWGFSARYAPGQYGAGVRWSGTYGAYRVGAGAAVNLSGGQFGGEVSQTLSYNNAALLVSQRFSVSSAGEVRLNVQGSSRATRPFGVSVAGDLSWQRGQLDGSLGVRAGYWLSERWQLYAAGALSRQGILPSVGISGSVALGSGALGLGAELNYAANVFNYSANAGYSIGAFDVNALLKGDLSGLNGYGLSAQARLAEVWTVRAGLVAERDRTDPAAQTLGLRQTAQFGITYEGSRMQVSGLYRLIRDPSGALNHSYGGSVGGQIFPALNVQLGAVRSGERTQLTAGVRLHLSGSMDTPEPLVKAFGGRAVGTLEVQAFVDANKDGIRQSTERLVTGLPLLVGKQTARTDAQGQAKVSLPPGTFEVTLGDGAPATLFLGCACAASSAGQASSGGSEPSSGLVSGQVSRNQITRVNLPLSEGGMVSGQVSGEDGEPLRGVTVQLVPGQPSGAVGSQTIRQTQTDAAGTYSLSGLPFGSYGVSVLVDPERFTALEPQQAQLQPEQPTAFVQMNLKKTVLEDHIVDTLDLGISLEIPDAQLPPGVQVPLVLRTLRRAESAYIEWNGQRFTAQMAAQTVGQRDNQTGTEWHVTLPIPSDAASHLTLRAVAVVGARQDSVQGSVQVDPGLSLNQVTFGPRHVLPGGRLRLTLRTYDSATPVLLAADQPVPLLRVGQSGGVTEWQAEATAPTQAGPQQLILKVGTESIPLTFNVLAPPTNP